MKVKASARRTESQFNDADEDDYELEYDREESDSDSEIKRRPRRGETRLERQIISVLDKEANKRYRIGEFIVIASNNEDYVALCTGFACDNVTEYELKVKVVWMQRSDSKLIELDEEVDVHEIFATDTEGVASMTCVSGHVKVLSKAAFDKSVGSSSIDSPKKSAKAKGVKIPRTPIKPRSSKSKKKSNAIDVFYCERSINRFGILSRSFDFDKMYQLNSISEYLSRISQTVLDKFGNAIDRSPKKEPKTPTKKNISYVDKYFDDDFLSDEEVRLRGKRQAGTRRTEIATTPRKKQKQTNSTYSTPRTRRVQSNVTPSLPTRTKTFNEGELSPYKSAQKSLHVASVPDSLPCREDEFMSIYVALEGAIDTASGSCVYISGIPGTGKTATVREVVKALQQKVKEHELPAFKFVEINGLKVLKPQDAYEMLWLGISGQRVSPTTAIKLLESEFNTPKPTAMPIVVLMDELDQLVTRNQAVMYNFFNWPTLPYSQLIVVAVANTMDLPERTLSNKISSRLGLTRIQFTTYDAKQLETIIKSRLEQNPVVLEKAVRYAASALSRVGDARRALDICRRAVEMAEAENTKVDIPHIIRANKELTNSHIAQYLRTLPAATKIVLCAVLARLRRGGLGNARLDDVLRETKHLASLSTESGGDKSISSDKLKGLLFDSQWTGRCNAPRMNGFLTSVSDLVEGGVIAQQHAGGGGEVSSSVQLIVGSEEIRSALKDDLDVRGML